MNNKLILYALSLTCACALTTMNAMDQQRGINYNNQEISFKETINHTTGEHRVHARLNGLVEIGVVRYTNNVIANMFVMQPYDTNQNGIIKTKLMRACLLRLRKQGFQTAHVFADRDASWYRDMFGAQPIDQSITHTRLFKLNKNEDWSGSLVIDLNTIS